MRDSRPAARPKKSVIGVVSRNFNRRSNSEHGFVELEGIEPSSARWLPTALRPFPCLWLMAATLPGQAGHEGPTTGSFPWVSGLCLLSVVFPYGPPPLLVTGCDGQAPRAIAGRDDSLQTD